VILFAKLNLCGLINEALLYMVLHHLLLLVFDGLDLITALPPVNLAAESQISYGINGGLTDIPIFLGTDTLILAFPAPVTAIQPRPRILMSAAASFHPFPFISRSWLSHSPSCFIRSIPGESGGDNISPTCFSINSSTLLESVRCSFISFDT
jgi:hypothetical protein